MGMIDKATPDLLDRDVDAAMALYLRAFAA
jgi:hypothetical protein